MGHSTALRAPGTDVLWSPDLPPLPSPSHPSPPPSSRSFPAQGLLLRRTRARWRSLTAVAFPLVQKTPRSVSPRDESPRWPSGEASNYKTGDPRIKPRSPRSSYTCDLQVGRPLLVGTLSGAWRHRVSPRIGWRGVSILRLGQIAGLIGSFRVSVAARTVVSTDPPLGYTRNVAGKLSSSTSMENSVCNSSETQAADQHLLPHPGTAF